MFAVTTNRIDGTAGMKEFRDLDALFRQVTKVIAYWPADVRRAGFAELLVEHMEFRPADAELYVSVVLGANGPDSAASAHALGSELTGRWGRGSDAGSAGNLVVTKQWTWDFRDDLTYEYSYEAYEGYSSPFGGGYSRPTSDVRRGIWAPGDHRDVNDELRIVLFPYGGSPSTLRHRWADHQEGTHGGCWIDRDRYGRI
jgi:hypothetical protein